MTILIVSVSKVDNPDLFLETWFSLLERQTILSHYTMLMSIAWWDENRRILQIPTDWVSKCKHWVLSFEKQAFFIFITWTDFETRFIPQEKENQPFTKTTNGTAKSTRMYKCICKVNKKEQRKVFYLKVWKIDSVFFAWSLTFEISKLFLYLSRYVCTSFTLGSVKATA